MIYFWKIIYADIFVINTYDIIASKSLRYTILLALSFLISDYIEIQTFLLLFDLCLTSL